jgi:replicative DNA helicase
LEQQVLPKTSEDVSIFDRALKRVEENRVKTINCIPFGLPRFEEFLPGIERRKYYLITANSGVGKTQIADHLFLYQPFDYMLAHPEINIKWFYWSLELDKETKWIQGVARYLFIKYGIRTDTKQLQSIGKKRITEDLWNKFKEARRYMDLLESKIIYFHDDPINPYGIIKEIEKYYKDHGTIHYKTYLHKNEDGTTEERKIFDYYEPDNPDEYVISITDHLSELTPETEGKGAEKRKLNLKETIEKHSDNNKYLRNRYGLTAVDVQQQMAAKEEQQFTMMSGKTIVSKLEPSLDGLAESKLTQRKANIVLGLFSPERFELEEHAGYNIKRLGDHYRSLKILKNREGMSNIRVGLFFDGAINYFSELKPALSMTSNDYAEIEKRVI